MQDEWKTFTTRPEIVGTFGVVASTHWIATAVGMSVLEKGGNAFDAAVATGLTLQVVEPHLNGPAGDAPILVHEAATGRTQVICGQGPVPAAASIAYFKALDLDLVPGTGLLPACVPGAFDAWMLMLLELGTMRLADMLAPAIHYARHGIPVVPQIHNTIATVQQLFEEHWHSSAEIFLDGGSVPPVGAMLKNERLAQTWERLIAEARADCRDEEIRLAREIWSQGFIARSIAEFSARQHVLDSSGRHHAGLLAESDLASWSASFESPLAFDYHGYTVFKADAWSQGPVALQQLALLQGFDLAKLDPVGPEFIHLQTEAAKLAFADREAFYGDPEFVAVPTKQLLGETYNAERRRLIGDRASMELRPGTIAGHGGGIRRSVRAQQSALAGSGEPTVSNMGVVQGDTCHVDIIDRQGNMVSATPSGGWLQSSPIIPELGFALGTRAQMFWLEPDLPNSLAPGKRPRTTLTPSMALREGRPYLAWGTPGGDQQDQWSVQFFLRHVHHGMNLQQAIDAPAWHSEHFPNSFWPRASRPGVLVVEGRLSQATIDELRRLGHEVEVGGRWSEGRLTAATQRDGIFRAAANARGMQGYAIGR